MAAVTVVHGVGYEFSGAQTLHSQCAGAVVDGVRLAGGVMSDADVTFAAYGDLFRERGELLGPPTVTGPGGTDDDVFVGRLAEAWWRRAAETDPTVVPPDVETLFRSPSVLQRAIVALTGSRYFVGFSDLALRGRLRQVVRYFSDPDLRLRIRTRVADCISDDCQVVVGHSLGSVVAYEVLCAQTARDAQHFVSLGSPLGMRAVIFDRLDPLPVRDPATRLFRGHRPKSISCWTNIVDKGDVVAAVDDIRPLFGADITHVIVDNGADAHSFSRYLIDAATGRAIRNGLEDRGRVP